MYLLVIRALYIRYLSAWMKSNFTIPFIQILQSLATKESPQYEICFISVTYALVAIAIIAPIMSNGREWHFSSTHLQRACLSAIFQRGTIVIGFNFLCLSVALGTAEFSHSELYSQQSYTLVRAMTLWFKHLRVQQFDTSHVPNTFRKNARGCRQEYSHVQRKVCASNESAFI